MSYEWTEEYLRLQEQKSLPLVEINLVDSSDTKRYSLCDYFHLKSKKKSPATAFRDVRNTDLSINTSVCEQQNGMAMAKDRFEIYAIFSLQLCHFFLSSVVFYRYSFCGMGFVNFLFLSRLSVHLHNEDRNASFLKKLPKQFGLVGVNSKGIAVPLKQGMLDCDF